MYPPLGTHHLPVDLTPVPAAPRALFVARPLPYKRTDVAVLACARAGVPLTVVGQTAADGTAAGVAGLGQVTFAGVVTDSTLRDLFTSHSVVLAPGREDFGFAPIEANYAGRPAIAVAAGGALETVHDGITGRLVPGWDIDRWAEAITQVSSREWDVRALRAHADRFGASVFDSAILTHMAAI